MKGADLIRAAAALLAIVAVACGHGADATQPVGSAAGRASTDDSTVVVDHEMINSIRLDTVVERELRHILSVAGKVQFDEDRLSHVLVPISGQIVDLRVKLGDAVRKGDALCAISSREAATAVGEHIESHKDVELAEKTAAMTEDLFNHEAASKMAVQQTQADLAKARSRLARSEEALRLLGLGEVDLDHFNGRVPITSPLTGTVVERRVTNGQFVQTDSMPIMTVGDLSAVWVTGDVFERDLHFVKIGQTATVTTTAYPGECFRARVDYISETIDPASRTAKVRVSVMNPGARLKPEMFASIALAVAEHERVITVPARAIFTEDGRVFVYAQVGPDKFARRAIEVGAEEGPDRRVLTGLRAGDKIVVDGALLLRQAADKRAG